MEPLDIFLHIPKTAGTTLHNIIWREYPEGTVYTLDYATHTVESFKRLDPAGQAKIRLLTGHLEYGVHNDLNRPTRYFTIMRDPIELVLSFYYFIRSRPDHPHHHLANRLTLPDYIASQRNPDLHNMQTRRIAGTFSDNGDFASATDLETAKRNIAQEFLLVGLTEQFDQTLILLRRLLGWQNLYYARMNVTTRRPTRAQLSPAILSAIIEANQLDLQLYEHVQTLFKGYVSAYGSHFKPDLASFQRKNRLLYPLMHAYWRGRQRYVLLTRRLFRKNS